MYTIRIAETSSDYQKLFELWSSRDKLLRQVANETVHSKFSSMLDGTNVCAFDEEDNIAASLKFKGWSNLPYYNVGRMYTRPGLINLYDFKNPVNPMAQILDFTLKLNETIGRYTWYYSRVVSKAYAKLEKNGTDLLNCTTLGKKYDRVVETVIKPGEVPKYIFFKQMMGFESSERPVAVVRCSLMNSHRTSYGDFFSDELKYLI